MRAKIIGYGVSGKAAENYLATRGINTVVVSSAAEKVAENYDFCVVSPGVPFNQIHNETVPVVPEIELPFYCEPKLKPRYMVAVTGTNGKTTVVNQIYRACQLAKVKSVLCGNVGIPISQVAKQLPGSVAVVEVSSFMLEQTHLLHPQIAVITNITPDHLDRHQNMDQYIHCKKQIIAQQNRRDKLVVNYDDINARMVGEAIKNINGPQVIWYSTKEIVNGYYIQADQVWEKRGRRMRVLGHVSDLGGMAHTLSNTLAVIAVGRNLHLPLPEIWQACKYQPQPHRMELVANQNGIEFYNDSKATNMAATLAAVQAMKLPTCLILCGLSKGQNYYELMSRLPGYVEHVIVFGAIKNDVMLVAKSLGLSHVQAVTDLRAAVKCATEIVTRPGVVLFSPSGSSFDMFSNYEHRGDEFRKVVSEIIPQVTQCLHPADAGL